MPEQAVLEKAAEEPSALASFVEVEPRHDLYEFTEQGAFRYAYSAVKYDAARHEFVASDARIMAVVKASGEPLPVDLLIPAKALRRAKGFAGKDTPIRVKPHPTDAKRAVIGTSDAEIDVAQVDGRFPNHGKVLEQYDKPATLHIRFRAALLAKVAAHAMRAFGKDANLDLSFTDAKSPLRVVVERDGQVAAFYLVMPLSPGST